MLFTTMTGAVEAIGGAFGPRARSRTGMKVPEIQGPREEGRGVVAVDEDLRREVGTKLQLAEAEFRGSTGRSCDAVISPQRPPRVPGAGSIHAGFLAAALVSATRASERASASRPRKRSSRPVYVGRKREEKIKPREARASRARSRRLAPSPYKSRSSLAHAEERGRAAIPVRRCA